MRRELKTIRRPSMKQEVSNMSDALAQMRRSGSIYFLKLLPRTAIQRGETAGDYAELTLPAQFIQENCDKIEEWVVLRVHLSCGRSSRPWLVRLRVDTTTTIAVRIAIGWHSFVADNRLKEGDSLIFLLKEDARSEFEVHVFRGSQPRSPHFPQEGENSPIDEEDITEEYVSDSEEEENSKQSRFPSPGHDHVELNKAFAHTQHLEKHRTYPGFRKRLTASNIRGSNGDRKSGQFVGFLTKNLECNIRAATQMAFYEIASGQFCIDHSIASLPLECCPWTSNPILLLNLGLNLSCLLVHEAFSVELCEDPWQSGSGFRQTPRNT